MHKLHKMCGKQHRLIIALAPLMVLCLFILAGCGYSNSDQGSTTAGNGGGSTGKPIATPTAAPPQSTANGNAQGCPDNTVYTTDPAKANVVVTPASANTTVHAHVGDVIEIRLPFGKRWTGPNSSQGNLTLQQPAGYGVKSYNACVWRFTAHSAGTTSLQFTSRALCKPGQMCPMYIAVLPVTIVVR